MAIIPPALLATVRDYSACFDRMSLTKIEHWMADRCRLQLVDLLLVEVA